MKRIFRSPVARRAIRKKEAWRAAFNSLENADEAFRELDVSIKTAIAAKNRAMRLVEPAAPAVEVLEEYQNRQSRYDRALRWCRDIDGKLNDFTARCENISFRPDGLRMWMDLMFESDAQLGRLRQNMTMDGPGLPQGVDVDALHALVQEAEILLHAEDHDLLVDKLEAAEQLAQGIEEKFKIHLELADYDRTILVDVTRVVEWTERYLASSRASLESLMRDYGVARLEDVAHGLEDATIPLAQAHESLARATTLLEDRFQTDSNVSFEFQTVRQLCWEVEQLCNAVGRRQRELDRELAARQAEDERPTDS